MAVAVSATSPLRLASDCWGAGGGFGFACGTFVVAPCTGDCVLVGAAAGVALTGAAIKATRFSNPAGGEMIAVGDGLSVGAS
jgi:hypothetical protein